MAVHHDLDSLIHRQEACVQRQSDLAEQEADAKLEEAQLEQRRLSWEEQLKTFQSQQGQKEVELAAAQKALALTKTLVKQADDKAQKAAADLKERSMPIPAAARCLHAEPRLRRPAPPVGRKCRCL